MDEQEKSARLIRAEEKVKLANDELEKVKKEEKKRMRKVQDAHKFMMGGTVARFFPRCYSFNKLEMYRIISYAFSNPSVQSFIERVISERPKKKVNPKKQYRKMPDPAKMKNITEQYQKTDSKKQRKCQNSLTEFYSVRTDIPPEVVCASCGAFWHFSFVYIISVGFTESSCADATT